MSGIPVLKPREVIAILSALGLVEVAGVGRTNSSVIPTGGQRPVPFHAGRDTGTDYVG